MKLNNIVQNEESRIKFDNKTNPIKELLSMEFKSGAELAERLHVSKRAVRNLIAELRMFYPIISYSTQVGYALPPSVDEITDYYEAIEVRGQVQHTINEIMSRIEVLKKELKPLIAYISELDKKVVVE